ncbi:vWA domain-containing protein [Streptosporangium carneum]|uniref:VWFA domain-containing protein n=1 Tax=Streptosporangium carneum TaxID=47481 RepID=A0A9W6I6Y8_9ACTN|nr:VWA domain-containing protein [Streptosporangium carneum]GLK12079.1 hypothetical protein GCM10017600_54870 [Streptosporangium carneum]
MLGAFLTGCTTDPLDEMRKKVVQNASKFEKFCEKYSSSLYVGLDVSGSSRDEDLLQSRRSTIRDLLTLTALCGASRELGSNQVRVVAFADSAAGEQVLYKSPLEYKGATANAQLRRTPEALVGAMEKIDRQLKAALQKPPGQTSDVLAQFGEAAEFQAQLSGDPRTRIAILTDGVHTAPPVNLNRQDLDVGEALKLADHLTPPRLKDSEVTVIGIGRTEGAPAPTEYTNVIKSFWAATCTRTGAACSMVTDLSIPDGAQLWE